MRGPVDLHTHSLRSDGTLTPEELVKRAKEQGLSAIALTDHDTVDGLPEALKAAGETGVEVVPGVELSTEYEGRDIHILGLFIHPENPDFLRHLTAFRNSRETRNQKMCEKLNEAGIPVTMEALRALCPDATITRSHYARFMLDNGYVSSMAEAFDRYIGDNCPYFVPREKVSPADGVDLILRAGGIPILAHPILYRMSDKRLDHLVEKLTRAGLLGIEAVYTTYSASDTRQMKRLAEKYGLCISGGSDFHGSNKPKTQLGTGFGNLYVSYDILEHIRELKEKIQARQDPIQKGAGT